jgi:hypothetical protein
VTSPPWTEPSYGSWCVDLVRNLFLYEMNSELPKKMLVLQKAPRTSFSHIFSTTTLIPVILVPKFSGSRPLAFHASIIHVYCILID